MADLVSPSGTGLKIIHASLFRMATKSMAQAYGILGYKVHHVLLLDTKETKWNAIERAAEATWPNIQGATPRPPFGRVDWDELWGSEYDVVTDIASPFVPELIKAYPDAKVVIVQRDFDSWWLSFSRNLRDRLYDEPAITIITFITTRFLGYRMVQAFRKMMYGFLDINSKEDMNEKNCRQAYEKYFRTIREMVPPQRRLEYKMGDGWEPLCDFLGVDVPHGITFPRSNDGAALKEDANARYRENVLLAAGMICRVLVGVACGWMAYHLLLK